MKLSAWAKQKGLTYQTAWNLYKKNQISNAYALSTGTIIVDEDAKKSNKKEHIVVYARVSSSENKKYLDSQIQRVVDFCNAKGWNVHQSVKEVGSGLNDKRQQLLKILEQGKATKLVVEHRDRLTRFGFNFIQLVCDKIDCELVVVNETLDDKKELIDDFTSIITSFCARIYGMRRGSRKKTKIEEVITDESD
jgi:putative resolvase